VGKLVQFETRGKAGTSAKPETTGEAEILIFTGVRYERQAVADSDHPTKPSASSGGKRKRG
jgi:hypothetical protein